jgi:hypothetical protein
LRTPAAALVMQRQETGGAAAAAAGPTSVGSLPLWVAAFGEAALVMAAPHLLLQLLSLGEWLAGALRLLAVAAAVPVC